MESKCTLGTKNETRIKGIEDNVRTIFDKIDNMESRLMGRPTWAVTSVIAILTFITSASFTFAMTVMKFIVTI